VTDLLGLCILFVGIIFVIVHQMCDSSILVKTRPLNFFVGLIAMLIVISLTVSATRAAVELLYFRGYSQVGGILLVWETEIEPDQRGFYITRSDTEHGDYTRVSELIPSLGSDTTGNYYTYIDTDIVGGRAYWYQLEMVDVDNLVTFSEKIRVFAGVYVSTATVTATVPIRSATPTVRQPTSTSTQGASATSQNTPSPDGTETLLPGTASGFTQVVTATALVSATTTLIPLPEITLQFPTLGANINPADAQSIEIPENPSEERERSLLTRLGRALFLLLVVLIWLVLGGWFYFSTRRMD